MSALIESSNLILESAARGHIEPAPKAAEIQADYVLPVVEPDENAQYEPFPLTEMQQAYWVGRGAGFQLGNVAAHGYMEVDAAQVDVERLETSFNGLIARHSMMRAVVDRDGRQRVLRETPPYRFARQDLSAVDEDTQVRGLAAVRAEMSHQVLDPSIWPLFDVRATRLPDGVCRLHLSLDVLIFDALSFDILSREWAALYRGEALPAPPGCSYADYVRGLELLRSTPVYEHSLNYWQSRLADLPLTPELPLARAPETITTPRFERRTGRLSAPAWEAVKKRATEAGATPSAALLTLFAATLSRWSARLQFTLNLTLFNRLPFHPDIDRLVGDFTSVIPVALDMEGAMPFTDRIRRVQERLWQDMDHGYVSGVSVIRELTALRRDSASAQLPIVFTSALNPEPLRCDEPAPMRWLGEICYTITQTPQVWLDHQITEDKGALVYAWDSIEGLFPPGMIDDMFAAYSRQLERLVADPGAWREPDLDLLPAGHKQLYGVVNNTCVPVPPGLLHEPVFARCAASPDAPALVGGDSVVSYREMRRRTNQLAHALWCSGMRSGDLVAVLLPKELRQAIAVLGILEAGGAYVPIEISFSPERIAQTLQLAGARFVVTLRGEATASALDTGLEVLCLDELELLPHELIPLPDMRRPEDPAYVIYTSGSTGIPKGVVIDHRGALNTVADINRRFRVSASDRVLALSALNFDLSVYDLFGLLAAGGAVVFPDHVRQREPAHWMELIERHGVSLWNTVPALMDIYVAYLREVAVTADPRLRVVMMSGDWIPVQLPEVIRQQCPNAELYSLGGATEASIWSIICPIGEIQPHWASIPYGKALDNQSFHVLDDALRPCPVWVPGELYIGGIGLAHGYWQDPARTAAAFIRHPRSGERLYRTGDLGRWLPDENIEFLGRKDLQVKINGYRVELGEVEARMLQFPGVQAAVATVRGERGEAKRLLGFFVREGGPKRREDAEKLRLRWSLPTIRQFEEPAVRVDLSAHGDCVLPWRNPSCRRYETLPMPLENLAAWLACLRQHPAEARRPQYLYGSAGGLYPVQCYLFVKPSRVRDLADGVYYYSPVEHGLVQLAEGNRLNPDLFGGRNAELIDSAPAYLVLAADLDAIEPFYGEDAFNLALLEAGLMTQLLEQNAAFKALGMCQIGGFDFERARPLLGGEARLKFLHGMVVGAPAAKLAAVPPAPPKEPEAQEEDRFAEELLRHLKAALPAYMVPSALIELDELSLSANGKVDRSALAKIDAVRTRPPEDPAAVLEMPLAEAIVSVWREVLGVDRVGLHDNIFDLGGTSVHMIKIHSLLQPKLPQPVSLVDMFFTHSTIGALLRHLVPAETTYRPTDAGARHRRSGLSAQRGRRRGARNTLDEV